MIDFFRALALCCAFALGSLPALAGGTGTSGATFLRIKPMARPAAMGGAYTGLAEGIEALSFNPAGITTIDKWDVGLSQIIYPLQTNYSYAAVARRFTPQTVVAGHLTYFGSDDVSRNSVGSVTGKFSNYDLAVGLSVGYELAPEIAVGGTGRVIVSELADFKATAVGFDLGVKYSPLGWPGITAGASLQNIGTGLEYISTSSPQPLTARVGVAWQPEHGKYVLTGDLSVDREAQPRANVGAEYRVVENFVVRGGFDVGYDATFIRALKLGMAFQSRVGSFDYAYESLGATGTTHRFSYSFLGGQPRETVRDTGSFFAGAGRGFRSKVAIGLMPFVNLSPNTEYDWLADGFREIFASRLAHQPGIEVTERRDAKFVLEGRYSVLSAEQIWVGVKVIDTADGTVAAYREATVMQDDLIGGTTTLAGAVAAAIPGR